VSCIPDPLPPRVELDTDTLLLLSQADQSLGRLARIGHFMKNSALLVKPLLRREVVLSSHIEGTQSGLTIPLRGGPAQFRQQRTSLGYVAH